MDNRLLKKLRKEANKNVYLIPWKMDGLIDEVLVVEKFNDYKHYHGKDHSSCSEGKVELPFSLEEGLIELARIRRNYIMHIVKERKEDREAKIRQRKYKMASKKLKKY